MTVVCEKKGKTAALSSVPPFDKMCVSLKITEGTLTFIYAYIFIYVLKYIF